MRWLNAKTNVKIIFLNIYLRIDLTLQEIVTGKHIKKIKYFEINIKNIHN